ncbi:MAG TPA: RNA polymerase sigma factor [Anaerostipes hadrus]|nr:RNA polymerase sigma factor [Anaerostipes hadrus]
MKGNGHPTNNQNISEYVALLYQKYSHKLYCNAFHYTSNPSIAEDGVQQIFERILLHPDTALHVPEHEIIYYLFAIQRNVMYTLTTDEYKNSHYPLDYDDQKKYLYLIKDSYIYLDSLKIIFSTLTPDFRDTIIFHYFYGFKYSEIACMFHISERAVKKRIAVAKKRVRTMFQKEDFL